MVSAAPLPEPAAVSSVARGLLGCIAAGRAPQLCWLDGGPRSRSVAGLHPREEIRSDDLGVLRDLDPEGYWIGWLSYEAGVDAVLERAPRRRELSGVCLRRFDGLLSFGPDGLGALGDAAAVEAMATELRASDVQAAAPAVDVDAGSGPRSHLDSDPDLEAWPLQRLQQTIDPQTYRARVEAALEEIRRGNTYQVNLSQPLRAPWKTENATQAQSLGGRVAQLYAALRQRTPASMGGVLWDGDRALVSNSPETLVHARGGEVCSAPIKGTRPRGRTPAEDQAYAAALTRSVKDAAEHVMIVDLVRNDLGRIALPGSVRAPRTPALVSLPTVHHLVSEVRARISAQTDLAAMFAALYPGGSITGAPKRRTLRIIESLETHPRGIYCGAMVLITPQETIANIAIRSGVCDAAGLTVHGGGGIVFDSDPEDERQESLAKVRAFDPADEETVPDSPRRLG